MHYFCGPWKHRFEIAWNQVRRIFILLFQTLPERISILKTFFLFVSWFQLSLFPDSRTSDFQKSGRPGLSWAGPGPSLCVTLSHSFIHSCGQFAKVLTKRCCSLTRWPFIVPWICIFDDFFYWHWQPWHFRKSMNIHENKWMPMYPMMFFEPIVKNWWVRRGLWPLGV